MHALLGKFNRKLPFLNISWSQFHRRFTIQYGDEQLNIQFTYINQALLQYVNMKHFLQTKKKMWYCFKAKQKQWQPTHLAGPY